jgi:hypothetical protein
MRCPSRLRAPFRIPVSHPPSGTYCGAWLHFNSLTVGCTHFHHPSRDPQPQNLNHLLRKLVEVIRPLGVSPFLSKIAFRKVAWAYHLCPAKNVSACCRIFVFVESGEVIHRNLARIQNSWERKYTIAQFEIRIHHSRNLWVTWVGRGGAPPFLPPAPRATNTWPTVAVNFPFWWASTSASPRPTKTAATRGSPPRAPPAPPPAWAWVSVPRVCWRSRSDRGCAIQSLGKFPR